MNILGKCMFCDTSIKEDKLWSSPKEIEEHFAKYGKINQLGCKVGEKLICKDCLLTLKSALDID